jgi:hypothetical protein
MKRGPVHTSLNRLAERLESEGIPYAIVGGMALYVHELERTTRDVDVLLTADGLKQFLERCVGQGYVPAFVGATRSFRDTATRVPIEVLLTGDYPGDGLPKPVSFPDPAEASVEKAGVHVIRLAKLVELKLASGLSAPHRLRDLADVQDLIRVLELPRSLQDDLDVSVRPEYVRLWDAAQGDRGSS